MGFGHQCEACEKAHAVREVVFLIVDTFGKKGAERYELFIITKTLDIDYWALDRALSKLKKAGRVELVKKRISNTSRGFWRRSAA